MTGKPKPKPDNPEQSARFLEAAKEAGVEPTAKEFERAFKKVAPEKRQRS
jgi:hypothetical protein